MPLLRAYQITGKCTASRLPSTGVICWPRSGTGTHELRPGGAANPECVPWKDTQQTGGVVFLLSFFDELIRLGYTGTDHEIVQAPDAGRTYLRDVLLPAWSVNDTWGRNYWDWNDPVQAENVTEFVARYLMDNPEALPNWRNDARNILGLFLNHTSVDPVGAGDVYSGAWAFRNRVRVVGDRSRTGPWRWLCPLLSMEQWPRAPGRAN